MDKQDFRSGDYEDVFNKVKEYNLNVTKKNDKQVGE